mmetsp:Transcript_86713/g.242717  ORF Transcript_86713/g.242717 Transcript_86713/m.242717 type:complete len:228 (-) Transcript_86713:31-714(-)
MQAVDVLRHQVDAAWNQRLEVDEGLVPRVRLGVAADAPPVLVPTPQLFRHLVVLLPSRQFLRLVVLRTDGPEAVGAPEGGDAALRGDAGARQDDDARRPAEHLGDATLVDHRRGAEGAAVRASEAAGDILDTELHELVELALELLPLCVEVRKVGHLRLDRGRGGVLLLPRGLRRLHGLRSRSEHLLVGGPRGGCALDGHPRLRQAPRVRGLRRARGNRGSHRARAR